MNPIEVAFLSEDIFARSPDVYLSVYLSRDNQLWIDISIPFRQEAERFNGLIP